MEFAGSFRDIDLATVLRDVELRQRTGRLIVSNGTLRAAIYFSAGQWLLAERSGPGQLLAQQFVRAGLVTPEQIEAANGVSYAQAGAIPDVQLLRALLTARMMTQEQLHNWAVADAVALLTVVLGWPDGEFYFDDSVNIPAGRVALPLPIGPLLSQALNRVQSSPGPVRESLVVVREAIINFVDVPAESGVAIQLTRDQWRLLTAVDGVSSLGDIAITLQAPESTILRLAGELLATGVVQVVGHVPAGA
jgi:hypothetical protein